MIATIAMLSTHQSMDAQIACEDFDGGAVNLTNGFDPANNIFESSFPFTMFGIFETDDFSASARASFALTDDSVADVSGGGDFDPFPGDLEGIFGMARVGNDAFFAAVAAGDFNMNFTLDDFIVRWTFDVSSAGTEPLTLSIDMGQMSNGSFDGVNEDNFVTLEYSYDGAPFQEAMALAPVELVDHPSGFLYRAMDDGDVAEIDVDPNDMNEPDMMHRGLEITTPGVTKTLVDTGVVETTTLILDKTPAMGTGAGLMDTYSVALIGNGSTLELRLSCDFDFEAFALDNIVLNTKGGIVIKGDVNMDGTVNLLDVGPFVDALSDGSNQAEADTNCDGTVNLLDVGPFVDILSGG